MCFSSYHLQETQLPPMPATNHQEVGFFLPLFKCAQNRHLQVNLFSQLPWELMEMEGRGEMFRSKYLVTLEVPEVLQGPCR